MTTATTDPWEQVDALEAGRASVDRSRERSLLVRGADARGWLGDLVTADVASLERGASLRSLLLSPTGRIRADLWIARLEDDVFLVLQGGDQAAPAIDLLRPYVLSSSVSLVEATGTLRVVLVPARDAIEILPAEFPASRLPGSRPVDEWVYDVWRINRGDPRMGVDFEAGTLPAESGLERLIDVSKGCFLGQESVARVRNLGHPPTVLRHVRTHAQVASGAPVRGADGVVGAITSAAPARPGGVVALARVSWEAADADLSTADGAPLFPWWD